MDLKLIVNNYKGKLTGHNKELVFDSVFAIIIRVGAAISSFIMNLVIARQLGTYNSGNFFLSFAVITVLATFMRMGGDNLLVRYVGIYGSEKKWKTIKLIVSQVGKRTLVFSIIVTALLVLFHTFIAKGVFHKENLSSTLFWMLLSTPLLALYTLLSYAFQGLKKVLLSVSIQNILVPITLSILVFIIRPATSEKAAELYFAASLLTVIITLILWSRIVRKPEQSEEAKLPEHIWKSSYALWSFAIVQMAMQWGGQFMAGIFCTQKQVAQLAVAQRTSMLISFILIAINLVSAPRFASLYKQGQLKNLKKYAINSTRLMVVFSTPIVLLIICFPTLIMSLFGKGFEAGAPMLVVLSLGQFINVLTGSVTLLLMMSGHEKDTRNIQIITGILGSILNYFLIKYYGAFGAAVGTALAISAQNLICVGMVKRRLGFNTMAIFSK
jgi:O-antigen/teichoic acid export membrane protein